MITRSKRPKYVFNPMDWMPIKECCEYKGLASKESVSDLLPLMDIIKDMDKTASKNTHYDKLDEWSVPIYGYVHRMMNKYGLVQGEPEINKQNPSVMLWCKVYWLLGCVTYSPHMKSMAAAHHASAWERNQAIKADLQLIINHYELQLS